MYFFSEAKKKKKSNGVLKTTGIAGMGLGSAAGIGAGISHLNQKRAVEDYFHGQYFDFGESHDGCMRELNDDSKKMSFKEIENGFKNSGKNKIDRIIRKGLINSKLKRTLGTTALVAGGTGALAYGASKLKKKKKK